MKLVFLGMPGAGKGTIAKLIEKKMQFVHISTGDILRGEVESGTELGKTAEGIMKRGDLVPDELMIQMVENKLKDMDSYILDGFPRTAEQATALAKIQNIEKVVFFKVDAETVKNRILSRKDDSGNKRADDDEAVIDERIRVYNEKTNPLYNYYKKEGKLLEVDASVGIEEVCELTLKALGVGIN